MNVLVIEAGVRHGPTPEIDVPGIIILHIIVVTVSDRVPIGYMGRTIANPKFDWTFLTVPQPRLGNRRVLQPRGKGLGGSSHVSHDFASSTRRSCAERPTAEQLHGHVSPVEVRG